MSAIRNARISTTLGELLVVAEGEAVVGLYFPDHAYPPRAEVIGEAVEEGDDPLMARTGTELREYLAGERERFDVAVVTTGSEFDMNVWAFLREIPYGETATYGNIARHLGAPGAAQRVGYAVGHNPVSVIIPCHRVVGADGSLTGYAGGLERKQQLLDLEAPEDSRLF